MSCRPWLMASMRAVCPVWGVEKETGLAPEVEVTLDLEPGRVSTHLAGLGIDITHVEEPVDHSHVLLVPHGGERSQHEG